MAGILIGCSSNNKLDFIKNVIPNLANVWPVDDIGVKPPTRYAHMAHGRTSVEDALALSRYELVILDYDFLKDAGLSLSHLMKMPGCATATFLILHDGCGQPLISVYSSCQKISFAEKTDFMRIIGKANDCLRYCGDTKAAPTVHDSLPFT